MFASLLRSARRRPSSQHSPYSSPFIRHADADDDDRIEENSSEGYDLDDDDENTDEDDPLLPLFSSEVLDRLPIYHTTHSVRIIIVQRCETTLSWEQLRSPQVSQFLVKPIQQQLRSSHFSRATLYALIANTLQFQREGHINPGNVGVSQTRALICELLAVRLLREYSTRELIDALFYDFDPLQGVTPPTPIPGQKARPMIRPTRISTVEIAIRAQSKKFLSHPLVVRQLEAVWAGTIVFHSAADYLHRKPPKQRAHRGRTYGAIQREDSDQTPTKAQPKPLQPPQVSPPPEQIVRRSVTLYDPQDASLFKLSRLRVPRYRQIVSTISFALMLGLFLAVLVEKSLDITGLEILFWFWSAGYMLDEIVGFTEQGFGLYILSVWNAFDLGILLMFIVYYVLRLYGIIIADVRRRYVANMAYDVLASTAVLLFPRLFSVLDHYRYFSQLLIAFRLMALDLVAILLLIVISCSGFFVAFTLAFNDTIPDAPSAAYALFQLVMGFTPAAWEVWDGYNPLGRFLLALFLFICHFLIVTILITVLTNSFMAVVRNANEEHQFLFAVNTISMVKSDALFSYIAPTNIVGWLLTPIRYCMPFRAYVRLNRTIIKAIHLPILLIIFCYERLILSRQAYEPTDLVERRGRASSKMPAFSMPGQQDVFSPGARLREPSVATYQKDRALAEVFRRPFRDTLPRRQTADDAAEQQKSTNVVHDWMKGMGTAGPAPPLEQPRATIHRLEQKRPPLRRAATAQKPAAMRKTTPRVARSVTSGYERAAPATGRRRSAIEVSFTDMPVDEPQQTEEDGDDELLTNDEDERGTFNAAVPEETESRADDDEDDEDDDKADDIVPTDSEDDFFSTPLPDRGNSYGQTTMAAATSAQNDDPEMSTSVQRRRLHNRNTSTNTILFSPVRPDPPQRGMPTSRNPSPSKRPPQSRPQTSRSGAATPGTKTPKRPVVPRSTTVGIQGQTRPVFPPRDPNRSVPDLGGLLGLSSRQRIPSFSARALDLASDLGDNAVRPDMIGAMPGSFGTQLETAFARHRQRGRDDRGSGDMANRIMLARMGALEEGFREVVREVKELSRVGSKTASKAGSKGSSLVGDPAALVKKKTKSKVKAAQAVADSSSGASPAEPISRRRSVDDELPHDVDVHDYGSMGPPAIKVGETTVEEEEVEPHDGNEGSKSL